MKLSISAFKRILFLSAGITVSSAAQAYDVFEKSIGDLQAALASGEVTSHQLVEGYLARIQAYDKAGPKLNAIVVVESFSNWFSEACERAGLPKCSAHGLRKAGATIAAENGATEMELMAIFGWSSPQQAAVYTRKANRVRLADRAIHLLVPERIEDNGGQKRNGFVAPFDPPNAGATKTRKKAKASNG